MKKIDSQELEMLLGAYRDGELTTTQQKRVEKYLDDNPQGQALLADINATASTLETMPIIKAPQSMAENIMFELERDELVGNDDALAALAGQKQLRIRRLAMVATLMLMVGVISYLAFNGIFGQSASYNAETAKPKPIAKTIVPSVQLPSKAELERITQLNALEAKPNLLGRQSIADSLATPKIISNSPRQIHLLLSSNNKIDAQAGVQTGLTISKIEQPFVTDKNNTIEYLFTATPKELFTFYTKLVILDKSQLHLLVPNYKKDTFARIDNVSFTQIETVASYTSSDDQFAAISSWDHYKVDARGETIKTPINFISDAIASLMSDQYFTLSVLDNFNKTTTPLGPESEKNPLQSNHVSSITAYDTPKIAAIQTPMALPIKPKLYGVVLTVSYRADNEEAPLPEGAPVAQP
jgi:hypothetical protein